MAHELRLKHMEFIQNVITRMNANSFLIKGWAVTLVTALFALAITDAQFPFLYAAAIPLIVFWVLDAYYLSMEKRYRTYFDKVVLKEEDKIDFVMKLGKNEKPEDSWFSCFRSKTIWPVYLGTAAITVFIYLYHIHYFKFLTK